MEFILLTEIELVQRQLNYKCSQKKKKNEVCDGIIHDSA